MIDNMWQTFMIILLIMNGMFVGLSYVPVTHDTPAKTLGDIWGVDKVTDMNATINVFGAQINIGTNIPIDSNTEATTNADSKVDAFKGFLFGIGNAIGAGIGAALTLMKFMAQALFGYFLWLDILLNPAWHPLIGAMNLMLKTVFFLIEVIGLISFAKGFFIFRNLF